MGTQNNKRTIRNLIIFTILVLASGWLGRGLDTLAGNPPSLEGIGSLIWITAPLVSSFLLRILAGDGWKDLGITPNFKGNGLWYSLSILLYPFCATFIVAIGLVVGGISFSASTSIGLFVQTLALLLLPQILTNIFEECGFRGYLAPKLYTLPLNSFVAHLLVGLIWGLWHLPYLEAITPYTTESLTTLLPRFLMGTIAASVVYGEIRLRTHSVWPAVLMQTTGGVFIGALMVDGMLTISSAAWLFTPVLEGGLMIALFGLVGFFSIHLRPHILPTN